MHARSAMIGAIGEILLRSPSELRVGEHQGVVPAGELVERALERDYSACQLAEEARLSVELAAVRVEAGKRDPHHRDARAVGDDLSRGLDRVAERAGREHGLERV